jgi:hypothetical protein
VLARREAEVGRELAWVGEAGEVTDLGEDRGRHHRTHALQRLEGRHLRRPWRVGEEVANLSLDAGLARLVAVERVEVELESVCGGNLGELRATIWMRVEVPRRVR